VFRLTTSRARVLAATLSIAGVVTGLGLSLPTATVQAAGCVSIYKIYYDSPGSDLGSNKSLNGEWIQLRSTCTTNKSLTGWKIKDAANHVYIFGTYSLPAGGTVKIHTGNGSNTSTNRYWGQSWYIWNNTGSEKASLLTSTGTTADTCSYTDSSGTTRESISC
jgi:Lamin Tail Domain